MLMAVLRCCGMEMNLETAKVMRISIHLFSFQIIIDENQLETVEYFSCLDSLITNDTSCMHEIKNQDFHGKSSIQQEEGSAANKLDLN